ncbi:MAG: hypothetical protein KDD36_14395 [Flavobacteriales bacterium]|nr:hypothetical protein [Flavobacteriales bacterium]
MKIRVALVLIVASCIWKPATSQVLDSLLLYLKQKPKFIFAFDTRRSFLFASDAKIFGMKAGLEFGKKIRMGAGIYSLASPFYREVIDEHPNGTADTSQARFRLTYFSPYVEYVLLQDKHWEFSMPLQLGFGKVSLKDTATGVTLRDQGINLFELSIVGHYKFWSWIGIGSGIGYRQVLTRNRVIEESLSAPVYSLKIKIFLGPIYRAVFPKPVPASTGAS